MMLRTIYLICIALAGFSVGVFASLSYLKLREIKDKTDNIPTSKLRWSMGVYMDNIPQNEQNILNLGSVPLKIYEKGEYSDLPVPYIGAEVGGIYYSGQQKFSMVGIVSNIHYNTDLDLIVVSCKCTEIRKI